MEHPDVLFVGGGVIGLTSAYFAARGGASVAVIERGETGREASWAGAGIVPPGNPDRVASPFESLRALSSAMFPSFSAQLRDETGIDNGYRRCGGVEWLEHDEVNLTREWANEGIAFERLSPCSISYLEPEIGNPDGVPFHFPEMAQVRNPWHLRAVRAASERQGVVIGTNAGVKAFDIDGDRVVGVQLENGERRRAGQFVVSAGAWTGGLLEGMGVSLPVFPVRGQMVLYRAASPVFRRVLLHGKRYLVPREDGRILVGSTEEPEAGFVKANTSASIHSLKAFALGMVPALADLPVETTWAGLRPGSPDGLPFLGRVPGFRNLFVAAGHSRAGIQLSIASGLAMGELLTDKPTSVALEPFRPDREPITARPAFRS